MFIVTYELGVAELIEQGYLAPLTGKKPRAATIDTAGLRVERGDYRESDLAGRVDDDDLNARIVDEIVRCDADRRAWRCHRARRFGCEHRLGDRGVL
jgi:hypothetical protein